MIVLDPFCGIGTSCLVSKFLKRKYIGFDNSMKYILRSIERIKYNECKRIIMEPIF